MSLADLSRPAAGVPAPAPAGEYRREVGASLSRVWENVFDWEHLPALHEQDFAAIELLNRDAAGWRVALTARRATDHQVLKLTADRAANAYVVRTESGPGAGAEIHTALTEVEPHRTAIHVRFLLPIDDELRARRAGERLAQTYARLWDEDEAMMRRREALDGPTRSGPTGVLDLGSTAQVRAQAPFTVDWQGAPVRIADIEGALVAFSAVCPHWLGPLDLFPVNAGCVRCPWHGYRFDVRTGESVDGRGLKLAALFDLAEARGRVLLRAREAPHG